jgi:hypothetical protein
LEDQLTPEVAEAIAKASTKNLAAYPGYVEARIHWRRLILQIA